MWNAPAGEEKKKKAAEQDLREGKHALNKKIKLNNNGKEKAGNFLKKYVRQNQ